MPIAEPLATDCAAAQYPAAPMGQMQPRSWRAHDAPSWAARLWNAGLAWWDAASHVGQCWVCARWGARAAMCAQCAGRFLHRPCVRCVGCALPLPQAAALRTGAGDACNGTSNTHEPLHTRLCGRCLLSPPPWERCVVLGDYAYPLSGLIAQWKFGGQAALARHFALWLRQSPEVAQLLSAADALVPMPLSDERLRERGYNPAALLAGAISPKLCAPHYLMRTRHTRAQSGLSRTKRLRNVAGAFAVPDMHVPHVRGARLVLADDVITTGATLRAATAALLRAGAAQVDVLCVARAV